LTGLESEGSAVEVDVNVGALRGDKAFTGDKFGILRKDDDIFQLGVGECATLPLELVMSANMPPVVTARSSRGRLALRLIGLSLYPKSPKMSKVLSKPCPTRLTFSSLGMATAGLQFLLSKKEESTHMAIFLSGDPPTNSRILLRWLRKLVLGDADAGGSAGRLKTMAGVRGPSILLDARKGDEMMLAWSGSLM